MPEVSDELIMSRISGVRHGRHDFTNEDGAGSIGQVERLMLENCLLSSEAVIIDG